MHAFLNAQANAYCGNVDWLQWLIAHTRNVTRADAK